MDVPFTADAFFEVFARYNAATWAAVIALWVGAAGVLAAVLRAPGERSDRLAAAVLAVLWLWGGLVYHATFFTSINPAAWGFAALFVGESGLLAWYGLVQRVGVRDGDRPFAALGTGLALYAPHPALSVLAGAPIQPRRLSVPGPTGIFTVGFLTTANRPPLAVVVVPVLWALIGGSAALVLGVATDYVPLACSVLLVVDAVRKAPARRGGARSTAAG
jgi:hypothetical protein